MMYRSTRGRADQSLPFSDIMLAALAPDGGLFVPETLPVIDLDALKGASYQDIAARVIAPFVDIPAGDLRAIIDRAYGAAVFRDPTVTPLVKLDDNLSVLELFHGPTLAFKDVALQFLGHVFDYILEKQNQSVTIIGATSGDTGSAALEAFRGKKNVNIIILHPEGRTSEIQRRQMTSIMDANVTNLAIQGTFDDAQAIVKRALNDSDIQAHKVTTAVNSINWARIVAQIVYYVVAMVHLRADGIDRASFAVPTGNFGNIYAAYVARKMGVPIDNLIIGSNRNDILTRFFESGEMVQGDVAPSNSPSMDIQISSNFERFLFDMVGGNETYVTGYMNEFRLNRRFAVSPEQYQFAQDNFKAYRCDDAQTIAAIKDCYDRYHYIMDPHTAVGYEAARAANVNGHVVVTACAHPAKFPETVQKSLGLTPELPNFLNDIYKRSEQYQVVKNDYDTIKDIILKV